MTDEGPAASADDVVDDVVAHFESLSDEELYWGTPDRSTVAETFFDESYRDEYEVRETYWVNRPNAYVAIVHDAEAKRVRYHVVEPVLDEAERAIVAEFEDVLEHTLKFVDIPDEESERRPAFDAEVRELLREYAGHLSPTALYKINYYLQRRYVGFDRIDPLLHDRKIEDISCDGVGVPIYLYHNEYRDIRTNVVYESESVLNHHIARMAQRCGQLISVSNPLVDASLPDGSRIQLTLGTDVSTRGGNFTIRNFSEEPITPIDLIEWNTFSVEMMAYFWLAISHNMSAMFVGGTASGKTTSMNAVSFFIPPESKVVTIEDTREITLPHDNWVPSRTRSALTAGDRGAIDMYQLLEAALRQRPEYLLVGEIRAQHEVGLTFFQAMSTGHTSYTTFHADSVETVFNRLEGEPLLVPRQMLKELDMLSIQSQVYRGDKRVRRTTGIHEVVPSEDGAGAPVETQTLFSWDPDTDTHEQMDVESRMLEDVRREHGWSELELREELQDREEVLRALIDQEVRDYRAVAAVLEEYHVDKDSVMERARSGELAELRPVTEGRRTEGPSGDEAAGAGVAAAEEGDVPGEPMSDDVVPGEPTEDEAVDEVEEMVETEGVDETEGPVETEEAEEMVETGRVDEDEAEEMVETEPVDQVEESRDAGPTETATGTDSESADEPSDDGRGAGDEAASHERVEEEGRAEGEGGASAGSGGASQERPSGGDAGDWADEMLDGEGAAGETGAGAGDDEVELNEGDDPTAADGDDEDDEVEVDDDPTAVDGDDEDEELEVDDDPTAVDGDDEDEELEVDDDSTSADGDDPTEVDGDGDSGRRSEDRGEAGSR